jgi:hypothetical protein
MDARPLLTTGCGRRSRLAPTEGLGANMAVREKFATAEQEGHKFVELSRGILAALPATGHCHTQVD